MGTLSRFVGSPNLLPHLVLGATMYWFLFIVSALATGIDLWGQGNA